MKRIKIHMRTDSAFVDNAGEAMFVIAGTSDGKKGWVHKREKKPKMVVVFIDDGTRIIETQLKKESIKVLNNEEPKNITEAVLKHDPILDNRVDKLAKALARYQIDDLEDFVTILFDKFENAKVELQMEAANVYNNVPFPKTPTAKNQQKRDGSSDSNKKAKLSDVLSSLGGDATMNG